MELTQKEADRLLQLEKHQSDSKVYQFPARGGKCQVPLTAGKGKGKENFLLDIYRGRRISIKMTYQTRARKIVPLARVDFNGAKHCNPDGTEVPTPHLHMYIAKDTATDGHTLSALKISQPLTIRGSLSPNFFNSAISMPLSV